MGTAQASDYLENKIIDHQFRSGTWAKPTALYVALFTAAPSDIGGGTEVVGGASGYARVNVPPLDTNWKATQGGVVGASSGSTGTTSNNVPVTYPAPTGNWGTVTHFGLFDAPTGGNLIIWDALTAPRTIINGDPAPSFPVDALQITVS
jgi:hypothetical protein